MSYTLLREPKPGLLIPANKLAVGELAVIEDVQRQENGQTVLQTYVALVSLSVPGNTWLCSSSGPNFRVRRLYKGESVTLTVS
jgi:hypothetical protein